MILISLYYAFGLCHSFKSCALPPLLLFHALFLSPVWAHNVASTIFWKDNQKIAGLWEGNTVISNPSRYSSLHLPRFLQLVQQQHLSVYLLGQVTDTQCLLEVHLLVASLQGQLGRLPGIMFATLGVSPEGCLGPNHSYPSSKVTNISPDQISTPLLRKI